MIAVLGGLGAALAFATSTLCSSRSSRMVGPWSVLAWVMIVGLVVLGPIVAVEGRPAGLDRDAMLWLAVAGSGNVAGLLLAYSALRVGKVGLVAPILSTQGAIAAIIAVVAGEELAAASGGVLVLVAIGIVLAATAPAEPDPDRPERGPAAVAFSIAAAFAFGVTLYATGRIGSDLPVAWVLLPARLIGVFAIAIPFAAWGRLHFTRAAAPLLLTSGLCEILGFGSFTLGARHGIAVSAVLASQFAGLAAVAAYLLFGERLGRVQVAGVLTILAGVGALSALQA